jgi:L-lactate utilization protein LutC
MTARDDILRNLRMALAKSDLPFPPPAPATVTAATPLAVTRAAGDVRALAERFCAELTALHGTAQIVESVPEARLALISQLLRWVDEESALRKGAQLATGQERLVLSWEPATLPVPALPEALADLKLHLVTPRDLAKEEERDRVRFIRYGVTGVEAAFAATGSMLMIAAAATNRAASLLPFRHLALLPFSRLYPTPEAWLYAHRQRGDLVDLYRHHANLTLISGPSKSADIEMNLTLGVHGPKFVHAILFDDQPENA